MAMDSWFKTLSTINLVGAMHALVQSTLLVFIKRGNRLANKVMALFLLVLAIGMANGFITILGLYDRWPALSILVGAVILTYGPLFYFYVKAISRQEFRWRPSLLIHFFPFFVGLVSWGAFWLFRQADPGRLSSLVAWWIRSPWIPVSIMAVIQTVVYVSLMIRRLREYSQTIKASYSTLDGINLRWLKWRLAVYGVIWAVGLAVLALIRLDSRMMSLAAQVIFLLVALNTFATGYRAMLQPEIFFGPFEDGPGGRYQRSSLTPENAASLKTRLLEMMEHEQFFLDPKITLPKLAQSLDIPANHLSQVINEQLGRNFFDFINGYRVEAAKRQLTKSGSDQIKMITVAFDCGFNSLATFNRVFKELAGRTPSDYRVNPTAQ